ncbi:hypothetical protein NDU88_005885 [Pleurodeles waltl]|uniref:Uncharacterized protein n=1 Tax=Pleurodeles waltl TaxID=8319 RepID=A0AAV7VPH6_PLEWA|nr:hypothetical protein NDU88_005885 [Pleurodeles waltl]
MSQGDLRWEEVWRWLEMWDKAVPVRTEGAGGIASRASGAESLVWRSRMAGSLKDTGTGRSAVDSIPRVEIQQDRTMVVVSAGLAGDLDVDQE